MASTATRTSLSQSGQIEVTARRTARRSNPADVRIEVAPHAGGVTICAVYPSAGGDANTCESGGRGHLNTRDNDTVVHFGSEGAGRGRVHRTNGEWRRRGRFPAERRPGIERQRVGRADDHRARQRVHRQRVRQRHHGAAPTGRAGDCKTVNGGITSRSGVCRRGSARGYVERQYHVRLPITMTEP